MNEAKDSVKYHKIKDRLFYFGLALDAAILVVMQYSGLSVRLRDLVSGYFYSPYKVNGVYLLAFCLIFYALHFPLRLFSGFIWEHRFGLSTQKFAGWLVDDIKKALLSLVFILVIVEVVYALLALFPGRWWLGGWAAWLFMSLFVARIMPSVIIPLFFKYSKIGNVRLEQGIIALFNKCKVQVKEVTSINLSSKTKKANAFVCGLGKNRRVVLTDNLLQHFSEGEIKAVVAHELGHYKGKDIIKLITVNACVVFAGFYMAHHILNAAVSYYGLYGLDDIAGLPVFTFVMTLFMLVTSPLTNAFSRSLESKADIFSLRLTGSVDDFISMMKKLADMNLAEMNPSRFNVIMFYDHPPVSDRIRLAGNFKTVNA